MLFHFPFFYKCSAIHESLNDHFSLPRIFLRISISTRQRDSSTLILFKRSTSSTTKKKKIKLHHFPSDYFHESISRRFDPIFNFPRRIKRQGSTSLPKKKKSNSSSISFYPNSIAFPQIISTNRFRETIQSHIPCFASSGHTHIHDFTDPMVRDPSICIKRGHTRSKEYSVERFRSRDAPVRG